jgi:hypothetical protein
VTIDVGEVDVGEVDVGNVDVGEVDVDVGDVVKEFFGYSASCYYLYERH